MSLFELKSGEFKIKSINTTDKIKKQLISLGFLEGTKGLKIINHNGVDILILKNVKYGISKEITKNIEIKK